MLQQRAQPRRKRTVLQRRARQVDAACAPVVFDVGQRQLDRALVDGRRQAPAQRQRQPARRRFERAVRIQLQAQRTFEVDQLAARIEHRIADEPGPPLRRQGLGDALAPRGFAHHRRVAGRVSGYARLGELDRKRTAAFSTRQCCIDRAHHLRHLAIPPHLDRADGHRDTRPEGWQRHRQRLRDRLRRLERDAAYRQAQRKVRAVQAAEVAAGDAPRVGLQRLRDRTDHAVGGGMAEAAVDAGQVEHAQQHEPAFGGAVFTLQRGRQLGHEMLAVRQARDRVRVRLLAQRLDLRRLGLEGQLQARDHRVHRLRQALQLGHLRLGHGDELAVDQRLGLAHRTVERLADAADDETREQCRDQPHCRQRQRRPGAAQPQVVVGIGGMAHHLHCAERAPAVGHLRRAGLRMHRQQLDEPGRRIARHERRFAQERRLAVDRREADAPVEAGVELCREHQLHQLRIALLLRQRERERGGVVAVLQAQLGLQRLARRGDADQRAAGERQHQRAQQQEPDLADQRHARSLVDCIVVIESPRREPWPAPRASATAVPSDRRRSARRRLATAPRC